MDAQFAQRLLDAIERNNSYWERYGPMLEEMWTRRSQLPPAQRKGLLDHLGEALAAGKLDRLVDMAAGVDPTRPNPRRRSPSQAPQRRR